MHSQDFFFLNPAFFKNRSRSVGLVMTWIIIIEYKASRVVNITMVSVDTLTHASADLLHNVVI